MAAAPCARTRGAIGRSPSRHFAFAAAARRRGTGLWARGFAKAKAPTTTATPTTTARAAGVRQEPEQRLTSPAPKQMPARLTENHASDAQDRALPAPQAHRADRPERSPPTYKESRLNHGLPGYRWSIMRLSKTPGPEMPGWATCQLHQRRYVEASTEERFARPIS